MNLNDKIFVNGIEYTIWLIEDKIYHLIDKDGNGICCEEEYLKTILI